MCVRVHGFLRSLNGGFLSFYFVAGEEERGGPEERCSDDEVFEVGVFRFRVFYTGYTREHRARTSDFGREKKKNKRKEIGEVK